MKKGYKLFAIVLLCLCLITVAFLTFRKSDSINGKQNTIKPTTNSSINVNRYLKGKVLSLNSNLIKLDVNGQRKEFKINEKYLPLIVKKDEKNIVVKGDSDLKKRFSWLKSGLTVRIHLGPNIEEIERKTKERIGSAQLSKDQYLQKVKDVQSELYASSTKDYVDYIVIE